jgi:hypothetical protein
MQLLSNKYSYYKLFHIYFSFYPEVSRNYLDNIFINKIWLTTFLHIMQYIKVWYKINLRIDMHVISYKFAHLTRDTGGVKHDQRQRKLLPATVHMRWVNLHPRWAVYAEQMMLYITIFFYNIQSIMDHHRCSTCNLYYWNEEQLHRHQRHSSHGNYIMNSRHSEHSRPAEHSWLAPSDPAWIVQPSYTPPVQQNRPITRSTVHQSASTSWSTRVATFLDNGRLVSVSSSGELIAVAVVEPLVTVEPHQPERSMRKTTLVQCVPHTTPRNPITISDNNTDNPTPGTSSADVINLD